MGWIQKYQLFVWSSSWGKFWKQQCMWKLEILRQMKGIGYVTESNTYRAFLLFDTLIRKIGFCPEQDSNPRLPDY